MYESKGLEFNDVGPAERGVSCMSDPVQVLLYNFFQDSAANASRWQLVTRGGSDRTPAPDFDETKHASICMEALPLIHSHPTLANYKAS